MQPPVLAHNARLLLVVLLAATAACASGGASSTPAAMSTLLARDTLAPCTAASADVGTWREVTAPGFRFCIPAAWQRSRARDTSGAAEGRWRFAEDRSIEWRVGPFAPRTAMPAPYNEMEQRDLWLGSRGGRLTITSIQDSYWFSGAFQESGGAPAIVLAGSARGAAARAELETIFRTLEPARQATAP